MLRKTLLAAAAVSLVTLGAPAAFAKGDHDDHGGHKGGGYGDHDRGGYGHHGGPGKGAYGDYGYHNTHKDFWFGFNWSPFGCRYEPQKVRVTVWDQWGHPHFKWVWRDVKVCT